MRRASIQTGDDGVPTVITFACPQCAEPHRLPDDYAGRTGRCTTCGQMLLVPNPLALPPIVPPFLFAEEAPDAAPLPTAPTGEGSL